MKLTFISTLQTYWGGSEVLWLRTAELAVQKGYQVQIVVYSQKQGLYPSLQKLKSQVHSFVEMENEMPVSSLIRKGIRAIKNRIIPKNLKQIEHFKPDCICISQVNTYSAAFHPTLFPFLAQTTIPFVLISQFNTEHDCLSYPDIEKGRHIFNKAKYAFFVSRRNWQVAERQIAMPIERSVIIDNPLNISDTQYIPFHDQQMAQFASVARLDVSYKGQDILFQILASDTWQNKPWHLNIYGNGQDESYLKDLCHFYHLEKKVSFHGHTDDIREIWKYNHVLLMPSIAEGKPLALEEAMVCGRIGIVSDVGGNTELIDHGLNGYIASSFFPEVFGDMLLKAWENRDQWEQMGKTAHLKMKQHLNLNPEKTLFSYLTNKA